MKRISMIVIRATFLVLITGTTQADTALLIHGYLGSPLSWEKSGINQRLEDIGWSRAGIIDPGAQLIIPPVNAHAGKNRVYNVALPSRQPLDIQAYELGKALNLIEEKHPGEPGILIGHSAGGLVARMLLVSRGKGQIKKLITIATPHLGTTRAGQGLRITKNHGPFNMVKEAVGGRDYDNLQASRPLLYDLLPNRRGNALDWLNHQPHPDIEYVSVIHTKGYTGEGDWVAPAFSQDMNQVPLLEGRSAVALLPAGHELNPGDAQLLTDLLTKK